MYQTDVDPIFYELSKLDSSTYRIFKRSAKAKKHVKDMVKQVKECLNQLQPEESLDCFWMGFLSLDCEGQSVIPKHEHIKEMAIKVRSIINKCMLDILTDRECYTKPNEVKRGILDEYLLTQLTHGIVTSSVYTHPSEQIALRPFLHMQVRTHEDMNIILDTTDFEEAFIVSVNEQLNFAIEDVRANARRAILLNVTEALICDSKFEDKLAKIKNIVG